MSDDSSRSPRGGFWSGLKAKIWGSADSSPEEPEASPPSDVEAKPLIDSDSPINEPSEDRFGVDRFTAMVANSLAGQRNADGTVVALHGPWGSGKSSAVNLALYHLAKMERDDIEVI